MRYEIKYCVPLSQTDRISWWLHQQASVRRVYRPRYVHSLYFDTTEMKSALDNLAGIADRCKYRLRWYSQDQAACSSINGTRFETKIKSGRLGWKRELPFDGIDDALLRNCRSDLIQKHIQSFLKERETEPVDVPFHSLTPKLFVHYNRDYYKSAGGIRITVDRDIWFQDVSQNGAPNTRNGIEYREQIVEFKFPPELKPQAVALMSGLPFYPVRSSKYLRGLSMLGHALYI